MNKQTIFTTFVGTALLLASGVSQARWMNPGNGRFMTMDSYEGRLTESLSLHKCLYSVDDPVDLDDPSGNDPWDAMGGASIIDAIDSLFAPRKTGLAQHALITGGTPGNRARRTKIDEVARKYDGSHLWDYTVKKDNFPPNSNKCNKFVYDVTKEAGAEALVTVTTRRGPVRRAPLAAEYADRDTVIPNWSPLAPGESPQPGDIAAYKIPGHVSYSGHSGLIVTGGNLSAHDDGVYARPGLFELNPDTRYRRYTGE